MIEVVINYDPIQKTYKIYEPSTDSLMVSSNLTEALVTLNQFLLNSGLTDTDLLNSPDISYHLDSYTIRGIIEGNLKLVKRLNQAPSGFQLSGKKFSEDPSKPDGRRKTRGGGLGSATGFRNAYKKFGGSSF